MENNKIEYATMGAAGRKPEELRKKFLHLIRREKEKERDATRRALLKAEIKNALAK